MSSVYSAAPGDTAVAGMLGMNRGALSFVTQTNTQRFSYCISDRDAGVLLIGASNSLPLNYTPFVQISLPLPYFDASASPTPFNWRAFASELKPSQSQIRPFA
ncbi:Aspartic proteinase PCS1 [Platanthera zijinensis]|uniref:Aspartic proteinase PCS1 n=1 Tax=Platanthera zijinensis TaxID=2320716 RepID=A0AAP0B3L7_9ASPA